MPNTSGNNEVQRLMKNVGNDVLMTYGCDASSAQSQMVPAALIGNIYQLPGNGFSSANYSNYNYQAIVNNLNNHWPVLLEGCMTANSHWFIINWWTGYSDCHEWVCDGYDQEYIPICVNGHTITYSYLYFHMNWGWHETWGGNDYNGWFAFDNWYITDKNWNFQYANKMTTEIHP